MQFELDGRQRDTHIKQPKRQTGPDTRAGLRFCNIGGTLNTHKAAAHAQLVVIESQVYLTDEKQKVKIKKKTNR